MPPISRTQPLSILWRVVIRAAGLIAVVLGAWSLWLGLQTSPKPLATQAFQEWIDDETAAVPVRHPAGTSAKPNRLLARITHVFESNEGAPIRDAQVIPASQIDEGPEMEMTLRSAVYVSEEIPSRSRLSPDRPSAAGAWLIGTIDEHESSSDEQTRTASLPIPAWKRGSKLSPRRGNSRLIPVRE